MTELPIAWQRLVTAGRTCARCADTGSQVRAAVTTLAAALAPLGIAVRLTEGEISLAEFEQSPLASNRILIAGRPVEDWLGGATGQSPCCDVCGPHECRTVTVDDATYETVPAALITRAGLVAAAQLLAGRGPTRPDGSAATGRPCCAPASRPAASSTSLLPLAPPTRCC